MHIGFHYPVIVYFDDVFDMSVTAYDVLMVGACALRRPRNGEEVTCTVRCQHKADRCPDEFHSLMADTELEVAHTEGTVQAVLQSFAMIIVSEIGDKTFLIAAILAMRHSRVVVFAGAFGSLVLMSILSAAMGHLLPTLIPKQWTQVAAAILFLVFGTKMMMEARLMKSGNEKIQEEMREAREEIEGDDAGHDGTGSMQNGEVIIPLEELEEGTTRSRVHTPRSGTFPNATWSKQSLAEGTRNFCSFLLGPVFVQAFILTFLGEWGDRSQIATIALAAAHVRTAHIYLRNPF
jgi:putative Ca2+/H+ antiporter (TMEM165/GDT1 family)